MREGGSGIRAQSVSFMHVKYIAASTHMCNRVMVPGYDDPILWEGHASMVHEIQRQLPDGARPDAIFCSLGGGGLAGGIIEGCKAVGWDNGEPLFISAIYTMVLT